MKIFITNRYQQKICLLLEHPDTLFKKGLAVFVHGLGACKDVIYMKEMQKPFLEKGFVCLSYDATHSLGESEGRLEEATFTHHYQDLEDVLLWAQDQFWYKAPFFLAGHSIGALAAGLYAKGHQRLVRGIVLLNSVISGLLYAQRYKTLFPEKLKEWQKKGFIIEKSQSRPGVEKRIGWSFFEDIQNYDLLKEVEKIQTAVMIISGTRDVLFPPEDQKLFFQGLTCRKDYHEIKGAGHTLIDEKNLVEMKAVIKNWLEKVTEQKECFVVYS